MKRKLLRVPLLSNNASSNTQDGSSAVGLGGAINPKRHHNVLESAVCTSSATPALPPTKRRKLVVTSSEKDIKPRGLSMDKASDSVRTPEKVDARLPMPSSGLQNSVATRRSTPPDPEAKPAGLHQAKQHELLALFTRPGSSGSHASDSKATNVKQQRGQAALQHAEHSSAQGSDGAKQGVQTVSSWSVSDSSGLARQAQSRTEGINFEGKTSGTTDMSDCSTSASLKIPADKQASKGSAGGNTGLASKGHDDNSDVSASRVAYANEGQALTTTSNPLPQQQPSKPVPKPAAVLEAASAIKRVTTMPAPRPLSMLASNTSHSTEQPSLTETLLMVLRLPAVLSKSLPTAESLGMHLHMPRGADMLKQLPKQPIDSVSFPPVQICPAGVIKQLQKALKPARAAAWQAGVIDIVADYKPSQWVTETSNTSISRLRTDISKSLDNSNNLSIRLPSRIGPPAAAPHSLPDLPMREDSNSLDRSKTGVHVDQKTGNRPDQASAAMSACDVHRNADMTELVDCQQLEFAEIWRSPEKQADECNRAHDAFPISLSFLQAVLG